MNGRSPDISNRETKSLVKSPNKRHDPFNRRILAISIATIMLVSGLVPLVTMHYKNPISSGPDALPAAQFNSSDYYQNLTSKINGAIGYLPNQWVGQSVGSPYGFMTVGGNGFVLYNQSNGMNYSGYTNGFMRGVAYQNGTFYIAGSGYGPISGVRLYSYNPINDTLLNLTSLFLSSSPGLSINAMFSQIVFYNGLFYLLGKDNLSSGNNVAGSTSGLFFTFDPSTMKVTNLSSLLAGQDFFYSEMEASPAGIFMLWQDYPSFKVMLFRYTGTFTNYSSNLPSGFLYSGLDNYESSGMGTIFSTSNNMLWYNDSLYIGGELPGTSGNTGVSQTNTTILSMNGTTGSVSVLDTGYKGFISSLSTDGAHLIISGLKTGYNGTSYYSPLLLVSTNLTVGNFTVNDWSSLLPGSMDPAATFTVYGEYAFIAGGATFGDVQFGLLYLFPTYSIALSAFGLPSYVLWWATVDNQTLSAFSNYAITFHLPAGSYSISSGSALTYYSGQSTSLTLPGLSSLALIFTPTSSNQTELVRASVLPANSLDPFGANSLSSADIFYNTLQELVSMNGNGTGYHPELATNLPSLSNGEINSNYANFSTTGSNGTLFTEQVQPYENYTFYISQNATWQDGSKVTALDVAYTFGALLYSFPVNPSIGPYDLGNYLLPNGGLQGGDSFYNISKNITYNSAANSVTFHFQHPVSPDLVFSLFSSVFGFVIDQSWLFSSIGISGSILPWSSAGLGIPQLPDAMNLLNNALFSDGPYMTLNFFPGKGVVMRANPDFNSPGSWYPNPSVGNVSIMYVSSSTAQLLINNGIAQISSSYTTSMTGINGVYKYPFSSATISSYYFNANIDTSLLQTIDPQANIPYNIFSNLSARRALMGAFNYSLLRNISLGATGDYGYLPSDLVNDSSKAIFQQYLAQNLTEAKKEWSIFANGSAGSIAGVRFSVNSTFQYNGSSIVIPVYDYSGDTYDQSLVSAWNASLSRIAPGVLIKPEYASVYSYLYQGLNPMPIFWGAWSPDYMHSYSYLTYAVDPVQAGGFVGYGDITPTWIGDTSANNLADQNQASQLQLLGNYTQDSSNVGNQSKADGYSNAANLLATQLALAVPMGQTEFAGNWIFSDSVSNTSLSSELNPYMTTYASLLYSFIKYVPPPKYYNVTLNLTGIMPNTYNGLGVYFGGPIYWLDFLGSNTSLNTSSLYSYSLKNGTYPYSYGWVNAYQSALFQGNVTVNGGQVTLTVNYKRFTNGTPLYYLRVVGTDIPVDGQFETNYTVYSALPGEFIPLFEPNGTLPITSRLANSPFSYYNNVTIAGTSAELSINYSKSPNGSQIYPVYINNVNLPLPQSTYLDLSSSQISLTNGFISDPYLGYTYLTNGTYSYTDTWIDNSSVVVSGTFKVNGASTIVTADFGKYFFYNVTFVPNITQAITFTVSNGTNSVQSVNNEATIMVNGGNDNFSISLPTGYRTFKNLSFTVRGNMSFTFPVFQNSSALDPLLQQNGSQLQQYNLNLAQSGELLILVSSTSQNNSVSSSLLGINLNSVFVNFNVSQTEYYSQYNLLGTYSTYVYVAGIVATQAHSGVNSFSLPYATDGNTLVSVYELPLGYSFNYSHYTISNSSSYTQNMAPLGYSFYLYDTNGAYPVAQGSLYNGTQMATYDGYLATEGVSSSEFMNFSSPSGYPIVNDLSVAVAKGKVANHELNVTFNGAFPGMGWSLTLTNRSYTLSLNGTSTDIIVYGLLGNITYSLSITGGTLSPSSGNLYMNTNQSIATLVTPVPVSVTIHETGLKNGTSWQINLEGKSYITTANNITLMALPGYSINVSASATGYTAYPGNFTEEIYGYGFNLSSLTTIYFVNSTESQTGKIVQTVYPFSGTVYNGLYANYSQLSFENVGIMIPIAENTSGQIMYFAEVTIASSQIEIKVMSLDLRNYNIITSFTVKIPSNVLDNFIFDPYNGNIYLVLGDIYLNSILSDRYTMYFVNIYSEATGILYEWSVHDVSTNNYATSFAIMTIGSQSQSNFLYTVLSNGVLYGYNTSSNIMTFQANITASGSYNIESIQYDSEINRIIALVLPRSQSGNVSTYLEVINPADGLIYQTLNLNLPTVGSSVMFDYLSPTNVIALGLDTALSPYPVLYFINPSNFTVESSQSGDISLIPPIMPLTYNPLNGYYYNSFGFAFINQTTLELGYLGGFNGINSRSFLQVMPVYLIGGLYDAYTRSIIMGGLDGNIYNLSDFTTTSTYVANFTEAGLPPGTLWNVTINGQTYSSTSDYIDVSLTNGTYNYTISGPSVYQPNPTTGQITINGNSQLISIQFKESEYKVTLSEVGLASGITWEVSIMGILYKAQAGTQITVILPNGTYTVTAYAPGSGYSPANATFIVSGSAVSASFTFVKPKYTVTLTEQGLPSGTTWYFNITGMSSLSTSQTTLSLSLTNGTYLYSASSTDPQFKVLGGNLSVDGNSLYIGIFFVPVTSSGILHLRISPQSAVVSVNGYVTETSNGYVNLTLAPGGYYVNVTSTGYSPISTFSTVVAGGSTYDNITLLPISKYGYLTGSIYPSHGTVVAGSTDIPVVNGTFNQSLAPGTYYVEFSAAGYYSEVLKVVISTGQASLENVVLTQALKSYSISGYLNPVNASVTLNGNISYVASNGYFALSLPAGEYNLSVTANGYYSYHTIIDLTANRTMNVTLRAVPVATSSVTVSNVTSTGYNVSIQKVSFNDTQVTVNYTATTNGTLVVALPYSQLKDVTLSELLSSKVYVNGILEKNFTVTLTSSYNLILTVYNLTGDPTLEWAYSSKATVSKFYNAQFTESGLPAGTEWFVNLSNGDSFSSTTSSISMQLANGTYVFNITSTDRVLGKITDIGTGKTSYVYLTGTLTINGASSSESISFARSIFNLTIKESGLPSGSSWEAIVNGVVISTTADTLNVSLQAGTYTVKFVNTSDYYTNIFSEQITISNSNVTQSIEYQHYAYLNLSVSPKASIVDVNGTAVTLNNGNASLKLTAGTYSIVVSDSGYKTYYNNVTLNSGQAKNLSVTLQKVAKPSNVNKPSPLSGDFLYIIIAVAAVAAGVGAAVIVRRRR